MFLLYKVNCINKCMNIQMRINTFRNTHCSWMSNNRLDYSRLNFCISKHTYTGVATEMRCDVLIYIKTFNYRFPIGIIVITILKMFIFICMYKIFTFWWFIPCFGILSAIGTHRIPFSVLLLITSKYCLSRWTSSLDVV